MSPVMPSTKYSCSGSPERFSNGSTAIEGSVGMSHRAAWFEPASPTPLMPFS